MDIGYIYDRIVQYMYGVANYSFKSETSHGPWPIFTMPPPPVKFN